MNISQATVNPHKGTIRITLGTDDEGSDLPVSHDLAPWPVDQYSEHIGKEALSGMGWKVTGTTPFTGEPGDPDAVIVFDIVPGDRPDPA